MGELTAHRLSIGQRLDALYVVARAFDGVAGCLCVVYCRRSLEHTADAGTKDRSGLFDSPGLARDCGQNEDM